MARVALQAALLALALTSCAAWPQEPESSSPQSSWEVPQEADPARPGSLVPS